MRKKSFPFNRYPNVFERLGYSPAAIEARTQEIFMTLFYGDENQRLYHIVGPDMACFEDTGNHDVRTEGMSYAMMMCVQMNRKIEFDRLWKWAKTYMFLDSGPNAGYFAWSCGLDGSKNAWGAAPDGEEYFAMALFSPLTGGGTARGFSTTKPRPGAYCTPACTKGKTGKGAALCGTAPII